MAPAKLLAVLVVAGAGVLPAQTANQTSAQSATPVAQEAVPAPQVPVLADAQAGIVAHTAIVSSRGAVLRLYLANGDDVRLTFQAGRLRINGVTIGRYTRRGDLEQSWRALLDHVGNLETGQVLAAVQEWNVPGLEGDELAVHQAVVETVTALAAVAPEAPNLDAAIAEIEIPGIRVDVPDISVQIPDVGVTLTTQQLEFQSSTAQVAPSAIGQVVSSTATLLATFVALAFMGFGFMFFAPRQLATVSDTVWHSFWRSFLAGLFATPLVIPVFGMMIVGLVLTVVGILIIPFAAIAFLVALTLAVVGGYVAVARTVGEIYLRRRMAHGKAVGGLLHYRYLLYGLLGLLLIWLPAVTFGWVPVAGTVMTVSAAVITWVLATAGFGATLISRAGVRGTFVRKLDKALTDEQYWADEMLPATGTHERTPRSQ